MWPQSGHFFIQIGHFFLIFKKEQGRPSPPLLSPSPSSYAPAIKVQIFRLSTACMIIQIHYVIFQATPHKKKLVRFYQELAVS